MRYAIASLLAACYSPHPAPGSPCSDTQPCADGLYCVLGTCETSLYDAAADAHPDAVPGCVAVGPELCGDGIDQDCDGVDPMCPPNDGPTGAIDITAGGTFMADLSTAHDDAQKPTAVNGSVCGGTGGRDLFYTIHLTKDEAYYLDTFGSDFDTVIRVIEGPCVAGPAPGMGLTRCHNDAPGCGPGGTASKQTQGIWDLVAGDSCVVVDQASSAETTGKLVLHVERGHRTGTGLGTTQTGNTSTSSNQSIGTCSDTGPDDGYYFTGCPTDSQMVTATTCNTATLWDTALYARGAMGQITCNDDDAACTGNPTASTISFTANGAHLFWIIVDSGAPNVGSAYELDVTIN